MNHFLYFVPGTTSVDKAALPQLGLGYVYDGAPLSQTPVGGGPNGQSGCVFGTGHGLEPARVGYHADQQTWRRIPKTAAWVGMYRDGRPTPQALARRQQIPGHKLALADGQCWTVPIARSFADEGGRPVTTVALPRVVDLDDEGQWIFRGVLSQYESLFALASEYLDLCYGDPAERQRLAQKWTLDHELTAAAEVLGTNYCVSPAELGLLGCLTVELAGQILALAIDTPALETLIAQKKTEGPAADS